MKCIHQCLYYMMGLVFVIWRFWVNGKSGIWFSLRTQLRAFIYKKYSPKTWFSILLKIQINGSNTESPYHLYGNWWTYHSLIHGNNKLGIERIHSKIWKSIPLFVHMYKEGWQSLWGILSTAGLIGFFFPSWCLLITTQKVIFHSL